MNRVTFENSDGTYGINEVRLNNQPLPVQNAFKRLLEYEKTGLEPEQVKNLAEELEQQKADAAELRRKLAIWEPW
jgi:hypothetical protein